jgi:hypothetical protein
VRSQGRFIPVPPEVYSSLCLLFGDAVPQGDQRRDRNDNEQGYRPDDQQNGVPQGGYTQTCRDIRTSGSTLVANCQTKNGKWKQSSLRNFNRCSSRIENNNGNLSVPAALRGEMGRRPDQHGGASSPLIFPYSIICGGLKELRRAQEESRELQPA